MDGSLASACEGCPTCPGKGKVGAKPGTVAGFDAVNQRLAVGGETLGGYLDAGHGRLHTFYLAVNGASTPAINGLLGIINDLNRIAGLLPEQAEAKNGS